MQLYPNYTKKYVIAYYMTAEEQWLSTKAGRQEQVVLFLRCKLFQAKISLNFCATLFSE